MSSDVWPLDVVNRLHNAGVDRERPFKCLLLMPFENRLIKSQMKFELVLMRLKISTLTFLVFG